MHWFIDPIKYHYADFTGRASRQTFWMYILLYVLIYLGVSIVGALVGLAELALLFSLVVLVPGLAITARRLHDRNMSGWWQLIGLVPLVGWIVIIILTVRESDAGTNQYGPNPNESGAPPAPEASLQAPEHDSEQV